MESSKSVEKSLCKYVFLDTQVHDSQRNNYREGQLHQLQVSCIDHEIKTISTEITIGEISDHITRKSKEVMENLLSAIKYSQWIVDVVKNISADLKTLEENFDIKHKQDLEIFLHKTGCHIHPTGDKIMKEVLQAYFSGDPPFKSRKNKPDLPDAIAFFTLKDFCSSNNVQIAVITNDARLLDAFKRTADHFISFKDIPEYLAHVAAIKDRDFLAHRQIITNNWDFILDIVGSKLDNLDISFGHNGYELREYRIEDTDLVSCEVANNYPDGFSASFRIDVRVYAEVSWYESGHSEDEPGGTTYGHIDETCTVDGFIRVYLDPKNSSEILIEVDYMYKNVLLNEEAHEDRDEELD